MFDDRLSATLTHSLRQVGEVEMLWRKKTGPSHPQPLLSSHLPRPPTILAQIRFHFRSFILSVSEELPPGSAVSNKRKIEALAGNELLPSGPPSDRHTRRPEWPVSQLHFLFSSSSFFFYFFSHARVPACFLIVFGQSLVTLGQTRIK